jgi:hypothetical protein
LELKEHDRLLKMKKGPEHELVRVPFIKKLLSLGWVADQIISAPEWRVPKTPHDASKREAGQSFDSWPVDIALFDDARHAGDYRHLSVIVETKAPNHSEGRNQLEIYFRCEPYARCGIWTNGTEVCVLYRAADGNFIEDKTGRVPRASDSLLFAAVRKLRYGDLDAPDVALLRRKFTRMLELWLRAIRAARVATTS